MVFSYSYFCFIFQFEGFRLNLFNYVNRFMFNTLNVVSFSQIRCINYITF